MFDQRIGSVQYMAVGTVILFELDYRLDAEILLQFLHIRRRGAAKCVDRLVVVADCKDRVIRGARRCAGVNAGKQPQPVVLQAVGILKFIDQDMAETLAIMLAQNLVTGEQLETAQQQFGEIDHALALALFVVDGVELLLTPRVTVIGIGVGGATALVLVIIDVPGNLARRETLFVDIGGLQQTLDQRQLILAIEYLKRLRQPGVAVMRA